MPTDPPIQLTRPASPPIALDRPAAPALSVLEGTDNADPVVLPNACFRLDFSQPCSSGYLALL